jgi:hypothetical protein
MSLSILCGVSGTNWFEKIEKFRTRAKNFDKILASHKISLAICSQNCASSYSMAISKKKVIKSLENLSEDLLELLHNQYPNGYESSITRITNAKREPIFVFPLETEDATYLVKVPVTKNSDGEYDVESKPDTEFDKEEGTGFDAESFDNAGGDGEEESEGDYDEEGGNRKGREASYDPDFDN